MSVRGPFSITLSFSPTCSVTGTLTATTSAGVASFTGLTINTGGSFVMTASSTNMVSGTSSLTISTYVSTIQLSASTTTPTKNFDFTVTSTLKAFDSSTYTPVITVTLSGVGLAGTITGSTSSGSVTLTVYGTTVGSMTISSTIPASSPFVGVTTTLTVDVLTMILLITSFTAVIFIQPTSTLTALSLTAGVYNNAGTVLENVRGPYPVSLSFSPTVSAVGTTSSSTTGGSYTFSGITLASSGSYVITVSSSGITPASTSSFSISNYVSTITLASSNTSPSVNFAHTITATLKSADGLAYTGSCTVTLSATNIAGTVTGTNNMGTITFSIYFTVAGAVTITADAPASNGYSAVSSTINENIQSMLIKITTFTTVSFT